MVAEKDAVHATLVAPEVLAAAHARLAQTQSENERICRTHRQLLMRYTAVKFMIDGSFRRIDEAKQLELGEFSE